MDAEHLLLLVNLFSSSDVVRSPCTLNLTSLCHLGPWRLQMNKFIPSVTRHTSEDKSVSGHHRKRGDMMDFTNDDNWTLNTPHYISQRLPDVDVCDRNHSSEDAEQRNLVWHPEHRTKVQFKRPFLLWGSLFSTLCQFLFLLTREGNLKILLAEITLASFLTTTFIIIIFIFISRDRIWRIYWSTVVLQTLIKV